MQSYKPHTPPQRESGRPSEGPAGFSLRYKSIKAPYLRRTAKALYFIIKHILIEFKQPGTATTGTERDKPNGSNETENRKTDHPKKLLNFENFTSCKGSEKGTSKRRANHTQTAKRPENDNGHIIPKTRGESCRKSTPQPRPKQEPRKDPHKLKKGTRNA